MEAPARNSAPSDANAAPRPPAAPAPRRADGIRPGRTEWNAFGRLDGDLAAVPESLRATRPPERVVHIVRAPVAAGRGLQDVERAFAAVRNGQLVDVAPVAQP